MQFGDEDTQKAAVKLALTHPGALSRYEVVEFLQEDGELLTFDRLKMIVPGIPDSQAVRIIRTALKDFNDDNAEVYSHDVAVACTMERLQDIEQNITDRFQVLERAVIEV